MNLLYNGPRTILTAALDAVDSVGRDVNQTYFFFLETTLMFNLGCFLPLFRIPVIRKLFHVIDRPRRNFNVHIK